MSPNSRLVNFSILGFIIFLAFAVFAFWPSYYSDIVGQSNFRYHFHGLAMTLWCLLLITQGVLIRFNKNKFHKLAGKFSYFLVPFIILTTINLVHFQTKDAFSSHSVFYFVSLVLLALVAFVLIYGLAMKNKKRPLVHARYMVCTVFTMVTPVTDRLIYHHIRPLVGLVPAIEGRTPVVPLVGFILTDLVLIALIWLDWKSGKNKTTFLTVLVILLIYQTSVLTFYKFEFWHSFCLWFKSLPLS